MGDYPEHEKLKKVVEKSQACGEFLGWLGSEKNYLLARYVGDELCAQWPNTDQLLGEFFGIDRVELEKEKEHMIKNLGGKL